MSPCTGTGASVVATSATGTITWGDATANPPTTANVDVVLGVNLVDAAPTITYVFSAQGVIVKDGC